MANVTISKSYNMFLDDSFDGNPTYADATQIAFSNGTNKSCRYDGSFVYDGNGYLVGGSITGFALYNDAFFSNPIWSTNGFSIPLMTWGQYEESGDIIGLKKLVLAGNDIVSGSAYADTLSGFAGDDNVTGNAGNDSIQGDAGNDTLDGGAGNDSLLGGAGNDSLLGGEGNDSLLGGTGGDRLIGGAGNDTLDGGVFTDRVNDSDANIVNYTSSTSGITLDLSGITGDGNTGSGTALDGLGGLDLLRNISRVVGSGYGDVMTGSSARVFEVFQGNAGDDTIDGGAITDTLNGLNNNRVSYQDAASAVTVVLGGGGSGWSSGGDGNDVLRNINQVRGSRFDDSLSGSDDEVLSEHFEGGAGNDTIDGRGGIDIARYNNAASAVTVNLVTGVASDGNGGTDTLSNIEGVRGSRFGDSLTGGNALNDALEIFMGYEGNDTIDGGSGYDRVEYTFGATGVNVTLGGTGTGTATDGYGGTDTLLNIEAVRGSMFADTLTGSDEVGVSETFEGREGNDRIDGRGGVDRADYNASKSGVTVNLTTGTAADGYGGTDTLRNIENVRGSRDFNDSLTGSAANNKLDGQGGNDTLNGGAGNDTLLGGAGNDSLLGGSGNDTLDAGVGGGTVDGGAENDVLQVMGNYTDYTITRLSVTDTRLTNGGTGETVVMRGVETVRFSDGDKSLADVLYNVLSPMNDSWTGTDGNDTVGGLAGNDTLNGLAGNDTLNGGAGFDSLIGGLGDDVFVVDVAGDVVVEEMGEGGDLVQVALAAGSYTLSANVENGTVVGGAAAGVTGNDLNNVLTGNAAANTLVGGVGNDSLDGKGGVDALLGGVGDDTYTIDVGDVVTEKTGEGKDSIVVRNVAGATYVVAENVEQAWIDTGTVAMNLTGNSGHNWLGGNGGNNVLLGGAGADTLRGYAGNDTLDGGVQKDFLNDSDANWVDYRKGPAAVSVDLSRMGGTGSVGSGTANDGMGGVDTLRNISRVYGSSYNDTILGSTASRLEVFNGGKGDDTINGGMVKDTLNGADNNRATYQDADSGVTVILGSATAGASGSASGGDGNDVLTNINQVRGSRFDDTLAGSDEAVLTEQFEGGAGNDTIDGQGGIDIARYNNAASAVTVNLATGVANDGDGGTDTLFFVEGVRGSRFGDSLTGGNALNDALEIFMGNEGNDTIDGGSGYDRAEYTNAATGVKVTLGGTGVGTATDGYGGTDTLLNIEAVRGSMFADTLTGSDEVGVSETFEGREGNDTIDGRGGVDRADYNASKSGVTVNLTTGTAADGYGGTDTLRNIENVRGSRDFNDSLTGSAANNNLFGQGGNDTLNGGAGNDTLLGGEGNDILNGGVGADQLSGGNGADRFVFNTADMLITPDTIIDFVSGTDVIALSVSVFGALGTVGGKVGLSAKLLYNAATGDLSYDADGLGGADAVVFAHLGTSSHPATLGQDFMIVT